MPFFVIVAARNRKTSLLLNDFKKEPTGPKQNYMDVGTVDSVVDDFFKSRYP